MRDEEAVRFRRYARVLPALPFARHTPHAGVMSCSPTSNAAATPSVSSQVRIVAILCSSTATISSSSREAPQEKKKEATVAPPREAQKRPRSEESPDSATIASSTRTTPTRRIYIRAQYGGTLLETLPLEVFRAKHPQVLIDYLLSTAAWS